MFVTRSPMAVTAEISESLVVLNEKLEFIELDRMGALVWERIGDGAESTQIAASLANEFQVDVEVVQRDIDKFLHELREVGLVSIR